MAGDVDDGRQAAWRQRKYNNDISDDNDDKKDDDDESDEQDEQEEQDDEQDEQDEQDVLTRKRSPVPRNCAWLV